MDDRDKRISITLELTMMESRFLDALMELGVWGNSREDILTRILDKELQDLSKKYGALMMQGMQAAAQREKLNSKVVSLQ